MILMYLISFEIRHLKISVEVQVFQGGKEINNNYIYRPIKIAVERMEKETLCYVVVAGCS